MTSAVLAATSFPWYLWSGNRRGRKLAGFWPGSWLLCTFLQSLQSIATSTTGSLKKKQTQRCVTDASAFAVVYEREANSLSLLWGLTVLGCERDHLLVFISAQALLKTVVKWCFFSELQIKPHWEGRAPFFPHQARWHLHDGHREWKFRWNETPAYPGRRRVLPRPCEWWVFLWILFSSSCVFTHMTNNVFTHISTTYMLTTFFYNSSPW